MELAGVQIFLSLAFTCVRRPDVDSEGNATDVKLFLMIPATALRWCVAAVSRHFARKSPQIVCSLLDLGAYRRKIAIKLPKS